MAVRFAPGVLAGVVAGGAGDGGVAVGLVSVAGLGAACCVRLCEGAAECVGEEAAGGGGADVVGGGGAAAAEDFVDAAGEQVGDVVAGAGNSARQSGVGKTGATRRKGCAR